jgi:hypothetical protein
MLFQSVRFQESNLNRLIKTLTLAKAAGLLVLLLNSPATHAQHAAYPRANPQPALQAASPQAQVPLANYQSALQGLQQGVESQSTDWRSANDTVGQFKRGHIDLLKLENTPPAQPGAQPSTSQPRSQP